MEIPIAQIEHLQMRTDSSSNIEDILDSFANQGQLSSIRVRMHPEKNGKFQVVFGNRRLAAARKLGWKTISAEIVNASDAEMLCMAFSENADRKDFCDFDKAMLLQRLHLVTGKTYDQVAELIGKSPAYVSQHISMLHLFPAEVASDQERSRILNTLSENHARVLSKVRDPKERWNTAKLVVRANLSVRELQRFCSRMRSEIPSNAKQTQITARDELRRIVNEVINGLGLKDITPFLRAVSRSHFTMFSAFPPFQQFEGFAVKDHLCTLLRQFDELKGKPQYLKVEVTGKHGHVVVKVENNMVVEGRSIKTVTYATIVFEDEPEGWKMVHAHWSTMHPTEIISLLGNKSKNGYKREAFGKN